MALEIASKEDFQRLENKLDEFLVELKFFNNRLLIPKVVTTKDICIMEGKGGHNKRYLHNGGYFKNQSMQGEILSSTFWRVCI